MSTTPVKDTGVMPQITETSETSWADSAKEAGQNIVNTMTDSVYQCGQGAVSIAKSIMHPVQTFQQTQKRATQMFNEARQDPGAVPDALLHLESPIEARAHMDEDNKRWQRVVGTTVSILGPELGLIDMNGKAGPKIAIPTQAPEPKTEE